MKKKKSNKKRFKIHIELFHQRNFNFKKSQVIPMVQSQTYVLGRSADLSDIILRDKSVSKMHLELFFKDNMLCIRDLDTKNGTLVNSMNILVKNIQKGDMISIGKHILEIKRIEHVFCHQDSTEIFLDIEKANDRDDSTVSNILARIAS